MPEREVEAARREVAERDAGLRLQVLRDGPGPLLRPEGLLALRPLPTCEHGSFLAVEPVAGLLRGDGRAGRWAVVAPLPEGLADHDSGVLLRVSPEGRFAVVAERRGTRGVVVDLETGEDVLDLERGEYHAEQTEYPLAWLPGRGAPLLVHGSAWNRLDVHDLASGACLTTREVDPYEARGEPPEHYLDYFHGPLAASPAGTRLADSGWVWHPAGVVRILSVERWLEEDPFESEDGESVVALEPTDDWGRSMAWLDEERLVLGGHGDMEDWLPDSAEVVRAATGETLRWFPGPAGELGVVGGWLVSYGEGFAVWDPETGERVLHETVVPPEGYHPGTARFHRWGDAARLEWLVLEEA